MLRKGREPVPSPGKCTPTDIKPKLRVFVKLRTITYEVHLLHHRKI